MREAPICYLLLFLYISRGYFWEFFEENQNQFQLNQTGVEPVEVFSHGSGWSHQHFRYCRTSLHPNL